MDIPTFRYMTDAEKFLKEVGQEVETNHKLLKTQQKALASIFAGLRIAAATSFDVSGDPDSQRSLVRKMKTKIDPELTKVVVPNMKKLQTQYNLAEDFYDKLKGVEKAEAQIQMTFGSRRGPEYEALMTQFRVLKDKISNALKDCLTFLAEVAQKHVPQKFQQYIDDVADLISANVIFHDSQTFMYVSVDPEGNLVFTAYIMLQNVANDEGQVTPQLYVSIQWVTGKTEDGVRVDLNHEYEVPNKLLGQGDAVGNVGEAVKAIQHMLEMENYSTVLGVVPMALLMNVDPTSLKIPQFKKAAAVIDDIKVDEAKHTITFVFKKQLTDPEELTNMCASIYLELKGALKKNGAAIKMKSDTSSKPATATFTITMPAKGGEFNNYDWEFLRDRFGLNNAQLKKIGNIINQSKD